MLERAEADMGNPKAIGTRNVNGGFWEKKKICHTSVGPLTKLNAEHGQ